MDRIKRAVRCCNKGQSTLRLEQMEVRRSGIHLTDLRLVTNVSKEIAASIFRYKEVKASSEIVQPTYGSQ